MSLPELWKLLRGSKRVGPVLPLTSIGLWVHASTTIASPGLDWLRISRLVHSRRWEVFGTQSTTDTKSLSRDVRPRRGDRGRNRRRSLSDISAFLSESGHCILPLPRSANAQLQSRRRIGQADPGCRLLVLARRAENTAGTGSHRPAYAEAATRASYEHAYWAHIAQSLTRDAECNGEIGTAAAAIAAARRGTEIDPNEPLAHQNAEP